ncbi:MAG: WavE lipopolysaccharide synthesis family protein [Planctomycetota bacterium]
MWKWEWICWFISLISRTPQVRVRRFRRLVERLSREADQDGDWWTVFREYPKRATESDNVLPGRSRGSSVAIVMQGPIIDRDDLSLETIRLYRRTMPNAEIIVSTWNDVSDNARSRVLETGALIVTSEPPEERGPHNLNMQIACTRRGMEEAHALGFDYVMKTRLDTRIHTHHADQFCIDLLEQFPVGSSIGQSKRIVVMDFATRLYIPYHPSDMMMFGATEDLLFYWSLPLCGPEQTFRVCDEFDRMLEQSIPEIVVGRSYFQRRGLELTGQLDQWWQLLADQFVVIDRDMIDFFWPKYNYNVDQRLGMKWDTSNMALCHFNQWMQIQSRRLKPQVTIDQLKTQQVYEPLPVAA